MDQLIGIDLGGTAIKLGRFSRSGELLAERQVPTPQPAMPGGVVMAIVEAVQQLDPDRLALRVGLGHPGPSDAKGRVARVAINLPGWVDVPLAEWLEPKLGRRVTTANDANCALVGEHWQGAARDITDGVDAGQVGLEVRVDDDALAVIQLDAGFGKAQPLRIRYATNCNEDDIGEQALGFAARGVQPVDMIPLTEEVETVTALRRTHATPPRVVFEDDDIVVVEERHVTDAVDDERLAVVLDARAREVERALLARRRLDRRLR